MSVIGVIPARYDSSRLPGKALAEIGGVPISCGYGGKRGRCGRSNG